MSVPYSTYLYEAINESSIVNSFCMYSVENLSADRQVSNPILKYSSKRYIVLLLCVIFYILQSYANFL
jgi:hypothetical protein